MNLNLFRNLISSSEHLSSNNSFSLKNKVNSVVNAETDGLSGLGVLVPVLDSNYRAFAVFRSLIEPGNRRVFANCLDNTVVESCYSGGVFKLKLTSKRIETCVRGEFARRSSRFELKLANEI